MFFNLLYNDGLLQSAKCNITYIEFAQVRSIANEVVNRILISVDDSALDANNFVLFI